MLGQGGSGMMKRRVWVWCYWVGGAKCGVNTSYARKKPPFSLSPAAASVGGWGMDLKPDIQGLKYGSVRLLKPNGTNKLHCSKNLNEAVNKMVYQTFHTQYAVKELGGQVWCEHKLRPKETPLLSPQRQPQLAVGERTQSRIPRTPSTAVWGFWNRMGTIKLQLS